MSDCCDHIHSNHCPHADRMRLPPFPGLRPLAMQGRGVMQTSQVGGGRGLLFTALAKKKKRRKNKPKQLTTEHHRFQA